MKTKTYFILCLLLGMGLTQLSAQEIPLPPNGETGSVSLYFDWDGYFIPDVPVNCDGVVTDYLSGNLTYHQTSHFQNGVNNWCKQQVSGELISQNTGEVFKVKDIWKGDHIALFGTGHINLVGSKGSRYLLNYTFDMASGIQTNTFVKAVCVCE
jgi:hypothetical protein